MRTVLRRLAVLAATPLLLAAVGQALAPAAAAANPLPDLGSVSLPRPTVLPWAAHPTAGYLTSHFGPRWGQFHAGLDIGNHHGAPVYAAAPGVVLESGPAAGYGMWVLLQHFEGTRSVYGHIDRSLVAPGQVVFAGQQIATVGSRGHSTGPHLHFEILDPAGRAIDPQGWLAARGLPMY